MQKHWINNALEHAKAATFCFRYLISKPFCVCTESILLYVRQGYYSFQDYAVQHCLDHFESCTELESHENVLQQLMESARDFLASYSLPIPQNLGALSRRDIRNLFSQLPKDKRERSSTLSIGYRTMDIRTVIERMRAQDLPPEDKALISNVYGKQVTYKCPKIWCDYFSTGFDNSETRQKHVASHERPFRCPDKTCFAFQVGYSSKRKLEEHKMKYHNPVGEEVRFPKAMTPRDNDTLVEAAGRNDLAAMLVFLESGVGIGGVSSDKQKPETRIPICRAAKNGHVEACKLLLKWGASLGDFYDNSPMRFAIEHNHADVIHCLLSGTKVEIPMANLSEWIHQACTHARPDAVRILLESSHFRSRGIEEWEWFARLWMRGACETSVDNPDNVAVVNYLLEKGFSESLQPEVLSMVKQRGGDYLASLMQPIIDVRSSSRENAVEDHKMHLMLLCPWYEVLSQTPQRESTASGPHELYGSLSDL